MGVDTRRGPPGPARAALAAAVTLAALWFGAWGLLVLLSVPSGAAVALATAVPAAGLLTGRRGDRRERRRRAPAR